MDSGTTLNDFPTSVANAINTAFSPAATYSDEDGAYIVSCTATAPTLAIEIGGTFFTINPLDMILDAGDDVCITDIDDGGDSDSDLFILGDTFQKNVVTIFDVGAVQCSSHLTKTTRQMIPTRRGRWLRAIRRRIRRIEGKE